MIFISVKINKIVWTFIPRKFNFSMLVLLMIYKVFDCFLSKKNSEKGLWYMIIVTITYYWPSMIINALVRLESFGVYLD